MADPDRYLVCECGHDKRLHAVTFDGSNIGGHPIDECARCRCDEFVPDRVQDQT